MHATLHPRPARAGLVLALLLLSAAPLRAQIDLAATVLDVEGALSFDGETAVIQRGATVTIRFTVAHIAGTSFQGGDEFNTTADVPPAQSNVLRKQTMASDTEAVPCSLAGCTGRIASGDTVAFAVTALAESEGTAMFTITTEPNLRSDVNPGNNVRSFIVVVVDDPQADLQLRIADVEGALRYSAEDATAELPLNRPVAFNIEVHNLGPGSANSVVLSGGTDPSVVVLDSVTAVEGGPCTFDPAGGFFTCGPLTMAPMDTLTVSVAGTGVAVRTDPTGFSASTGHPNDPDFSNNDALLAYVVRDVPLASRILGTLYLDIDADGVQDLPDEQGLEGQVVFVDVNANGVYDAGTDTSNVTIADGTFVLDIPPVDEPVTVGGVLTDGWEWTVPADGFQTVGAGGGEGVDFGTRPRNSAILGAIWDDGDGDGQVDPDEPRLAGWRVYADLNGNGAFDEGEPSDVSDRSGLYVIPDLAAGTYTVRQVPQDGFVQTFPTDAYTVTLGDREFARGRNFSNRPESTLLGSISGRVVDLDSDPDVGLDSLVVELRDAEGGLVATDTTRSVDLNGDGQIDPTTERGHYTFEGLPEGTYTVGLQTVPTGTRVVLPGGFLEEEYTVELDAGEQAGLPAIGLSRLGVIFGTKFLEVYSKADRRNRRFPLFLDNSIRIVIEDARTGEVVQDGITLFEGGYAWGVPAGEYIVRETVSQGRSLSDIDYTALFPQEEDGHRITIEEGQIVEADFVNARLHSFSGLKFEDLNGNGRRDPGEPRLSGWTIRIAGPDGVRETVTDQNGDYRFGDLLPGLYLVAEDPASMPGFRQTYPPTPEHQITTDFDDISRRNDLDFGNQRVADVPVNDSGDGEALREAIEGCNARPASDPPCRVRPGGGKRASDTIRLTRPLPPITRPAVIDGGGVLVLDGSAAGAEAHGIVVATGGVDLLGLTVTGFSGHAVVLDGEDRNRVLDNVLTDNGGAGIHVLSGADHVFLGNVIAGNGGLAIDLGGDGPTANDPDDTDGRQNYPTIEAVATDSGLVVEGALSSTPDTTFVLEFFAQTDCASFGEAQILLGTTPVFTDSLGRAAFTEPIDTTFAEPHFITATATHPRGRTSELSPCTPIVATAAVDPANPVQPAAFRLHANYPNPFNPSTTIRFEVPERERVLLRVYNVLGQVVATLVDETLPAGPHTAVFDAGRLPSGVYVYRLATGGFVRTRSMVLLR